MAFGTKPVNKVSDAEWFLKEAAEKLDWKDLSGDIVMDIGCGTGKSSAVFLEMFSDVQRIIAIDLHKRNIEEAQANNPHEKLQYEVADIEDSSKLTKFKNKISKAISTYCFNTLRRMDEAFKNLYHLLAVNGEAALIIKLYGHFDKLLEHVYSNEEWIPYLPSYTDIILPEHIRQMTPEDYELSAKKAGFTVIDFKRTEQKYVYDSEDEFKNCLFQSLPIVKKMDQNLEAKFKDFLLKTTLQLHPKIDGKLYLPNNILSLLIRKPARLDL